MYAKDGVTQIELIQTDDIDGVPTYRRFIEGDSNKDKVTNIKTNENGRFNITGLNLGTYYLEETEAPKGYNKLTDKIKVTFTKDGVDGATFVRLLQGTSETNVINVKNNTGSILPSTGGMGTTLIYLIGGALVLGSGFVLANKKERKLNNWIEWIYVVEGVFYILLTTVKKRIVANVCYSPVLTVVE